MNDKRLGNILVLGLGILLALIFLCVVLGSQTTVYLRPVGP